MRVSATTPRLDALGPGDIRSAYAMFGGPKTDRAGGDLLTELGWVLPEVIRRSRNLTSESRLPYEQALTTLCPVQPHGSSIEAPHCLENAVSENHQARVAQRRDVSAPTDEERQPSPLGGVS